MLQKNYMSLNSFEIFEKQNFHLKLNSSTKINEEFTDLKLPNLNCQTIKK